MNIVKGSIVGASAGRDKGGWFVVLGVDGRYAYIADGKRRRVEAPKKKKLIHLTPTTTVYKGSCETNPQVRKILKQFNGG